MTIHQSHKRRYPRCHVASKLNKVLYLLWLIFIILVIRPAEGRSYFFNRPSSSSPIDDPYAALGVRRHASTEEIKAAYRAKAKEWHPDKNPDDPEVAAQKFRQIASAYEILSDPVKKRQYDDQIRREEQYKRQQERQQRQRQERENRNRMDRERQAASKRAVFLPKARKLQEDRVVRITTLDELEQIALETQRNTFRQNVLMVFVPDKKVEKFVDDVLLFPFLSNLDGMDEDLFLPIKVRYNRHTELTTMFDVPNYTQRSRNAFVVLGKKGQNPFYRLMSYRVAPGGGDAHAQFEAWVTNQLAVPVEVLNHHHSPVMVFQKTRLASTSESIEPKIRYVIKPQWGQRLDLRLGDTLVAMDANVDKWGPGNHPRLDMAQVLKAQENIMLGRWRPSLSDNGETVQIHVRSKRCIDWSTSCADWMKRQTKKPCGDQPEFLHAMCARSCGVCHDTFPYSIMDYWPSYYGIFHEPLSYWPEWSHRVMKFVRVFTEDVDHVWKFRKNAGFAFFLGGILLGCMLESVSAAIWSRSLVRIVIQALFWPVVLVGLPLLADHHHMLDDRHPFVKDMIHVMEYRKNVMAALVLIGLVLAFLFLSWRRQRYSGSGCPRNHEKLNGKVKAE